MTQEEIQNKIYNLVKSGNQKEFENFVEKLEPTIENRIMIEFNRNIIAQHPKVKYNKD